MCCHTLVPVPSYGVKAQAAPRQIQRERRQDQPLHERGNPDGHFADVHERHQARTLPAQPDRGVGPLAQRGIAHSDDEGEQPDGEPIPLLDRRCANDEQRNDQRRGTNEYVPSRAMGDGEGNLRGLRFGMAALISFGEAKAMEARSPCMPAPTAIG